ncbi:carbonic anhydrase family protein [Paraurantiacibacter namhicola]|uniref:Carbonic anhydrase 2 n=1 Tax=Paraurantiacibacter namhicola TaxID=645517 RepID=A0A1C7D520_9SPHN|nr:carbonic anhydrase family protein [Paraurantiacibacter namhicola]ANU06560.1 Carbonic anhydrase 2 [Paraurantiacibacter namhicola]
MTEESSINVQREGLVEKVLTKEEQDRLTPAAVIDLLKQGNARFANGDVTLRNHVAQVRMAAASQFPKAIVLSCVDSRVPVEDVFDRGIGDLFVARVAGNFVNTDILGSMEFACKVSGSKLILVLGHQHCGAVKSAVDAVELGNITAMLSKIRPAVEAVEEGGDRSSANDDFVHRVATHNVERNIERIREESPILREMEENGEIAIVGGMYSLETGKVTFFGD